MKLTVKNLGKIKSAELSIKPITVLVGENNTNKSWAAYAAYSLLVAGSSSSSRGGTEGEEASLSTPALKSKIKLLADEAAARIASAPKDVVVQLEYSRETILDNISGSITLSRSAKELASVLGVPRALVEKSSATLTLPRDHFKRSAKYLFIQIDRKNGILIHGEADRPPVGEIRLEAFSFDNSAKDLGLRSLTVNYRGNERVDWQATTSSLMADFIARSFSTVVALPAERKGIAEVYRYIANESLRGLPAVVRDYVSALRRAESSKREPPRTKRNGNATIDLEKLLGDILGGKIAFRGEEGKSRQLEFSPEEHISVPLQAASSMARSLAGLALLLPELNGSGNAIVIDEPEMNAHPHAQLALAELMAILANRGNTILMTTHSPYIIDHFNNLLAGGELSAAQQSEASQKLILNSENAFLKSGSVSAYELSTSGKVEDILDAKRGRIKTQTFGKISTDLENIYSDFLELGAK